RPFCARPPRMRHDARREHGSRSPAGSRMASAVSTSLPFCRTETLRPGAGRHRARVAYPRCVRRDAAARRSLPPPARSLRPMNVQLIHPPVYLNVHAMTALRPSLPLGLAYVAAALRRAGHAVSVIDAVAEAPDQVTQGARKQLFALGLTVPEIVARLDPAADVIGVTNMWSFSWPLVRELITAIKQARPDTPIVCGGEHFTGLAEHSMQQAPIDVIVLGEGEEGAVEGVAELAKERPDFAAIPSIVYRDASGQPVRSAAMRARKKDVDSIAWPAWDLFRIDTYNHHNYVNGVKMGKTIPILATRGCPYQCTYCSSPNMWTTKWYARNPKDVVDEKIGRASCR